jgi:hypothetical protein
MQGQRRKKMTDIGLSKEIMDAWAKLKREQYELTALLGRHRAENDKRYGLIVKRAFEVDSK